MKFLKEVWLQFMFELYLSLEVRRSVKLNAMRKLVKENPGVQAGLCPELDEARRIVQENKM